MGAQPEGGLTPTGTIASGADRRRVIFATVVGTTIEWYDFFTYAAMSGLAFGVLFFEPAGPEFGRILAFLTVGLSFLFRPLGAFLAGHFGDRIGRRKVLVITLFGMGVATALIGLLPTYQAIGVVAPVLLVLLRVLQGISAGGEWGGAVLMAVEHAPRSRRGAYGASPQVGVPLGLLLSSAVIAIMSMVAPGDAFLEWGWRVPFLLSVALILVGWWIRRSVEESPVFTEIAERAAQTKTPIVALFRNYGLVVVIAALVFAGNNAVGYMTTGGWIQGYATNGLGLTRPEVLWAVAFGAIVWLVSTWFAGGLSDRIGRRSTYLLGWALQLVGVFTLFPLVNTGELVPFALGLMILSIGLGFTYGPQAAFYAEIFPASVRFSGVSISYALGAILGGAFAPTVAEWLVQTTGGTDSVTIYLAVMTVIGLLATLAFRDRSGLPLGIDHETEQARTPLQGVGVTD
ncbi:MFS transporter [Microbacterium esteraromaticum]|uniref:MFS transporter n=1 Tax=Microbacterium esteraromaticum TaxID=57043 RepID=UPI001956E141|nr:MFS transporter [Microbacterium esteraromaticum]MBM7466884.1 MFS family permease [Microbacterium esteraromaticum]